ncbi:MAG TPA: penicillin-binding transpeptidase domain-containing protein, partial [Telluria sp.]|nr:penicillin-binding transpeptidase domain-containing protein [Telluria sp.]
WPDGALRLRRHASASCPGAGVLEIQWLRKQAVSSARAQVSAMVPGREPVTAWLSSGTYEVPSEPRPGLEDQALFQQLQALRLVRLAPDGTVDLAPRDLLAWAAAPASARAAELSDWKDAPGGTETARALRRLYRMADGAFVRQQIAVFNAERRLLAVRTRAGAAQGEWAANVGGSAAGTTVGLPPAASALFGDLPQGWSAWTRVAQWPDAEPGAATRMHLALAPNTSHVELMLVGRLEGVEGGRVLERTPACTGRLCARRDAVTRLVLAPEPGAASITFSATPLPLAELASPGDARYRFLRVEDGKLVWHPLDNTAPAPTARGSARIADRSGTPLWTGGAPTAEAVRAGLAPLVGVRAEQANSVAGMLERLGGVHDANLTVDLALQTLAQDILDCVGLKRGHWVRGACAGGASVPAGRHAGFVVVDTQTGEILVAAGAGMGDPLAAPWPEVRDFDRANPAASPLRLPAFQHDGGVHSSPGSTFKIVSALGLELAAQRNPGLDTLLAGLPLSAINRTAHERGFEFRTDAPTYPLDLRRAHVTNYRDGQLDRRAAEGRFGLPQALTYSLNTWFAWSAELSDASLEGKPDGGIPMLQALDPHALGLARPIAGMARLVGFERSWRLDGGLLPPDFRWNRWDALQTTPAHIDPIRSRHELRQMAIGIRMQATPLQMALAAGAVGEGKVVTPVLLRTLDGKPAAPAEGPQLAVRLDRIKAGMKGVIERGTAAGAFRTAVPPAVRAGLYGKTGTAPTTALGPDGERHAVATVWFAGWLEPNSLPGQAHRWALAAYASHSDATGGEHAAPVVAAFLAALARNDEQAAKTPVSERLGR